MNIFLYTDYRAWLQETIEELKVVKPFVSIRYICQKENLDPGNFVRVLQGKLNLTRRSILSLSNFFELDKKQIEYFEELVFFAKAKTDKEAWQRFARLQDIKGVEVRVLADYEFEYFSKWYHPVVRSLLSIIRFNGNYQSLANMLVPIISVPEVKESVALLEKLEMVKKEKGFWKVTGKFVRNDQKFSRQCIREYQAQNIALAKKSLEEHDPDIRDISTVSLTLAMDQLALFKSKAKEFREELLQMAKEITENDAVYQVNISMFPVGFTKKGIQ